MVRTLLIQGMLAGILAGLLVFGFATLFGEPQVDAAIAFEASHAAAHAAEEVALGLSHSHDEAALVSRAVQSTWGLLTGVMVYAVAFGGLFALVFAYVSVRVSPFGPRGTAALLAALGFIACYLVPSLKYPANPPASGDPDTIGMRTLLYVLMIALSTASMIGAVGLGRAQIRQHGAWTAWLCGAGTYLSLMGLAFAVLPAISEVPEGFPASVLWDFRISSAGMQAIMWAVIGLGFGALAERTYIDHGYRPARDLAAQYR